MKILKKIKNYPKISKYFYDIFARTELTLKVGLGVNAGYGIFKLTSGVFYRSLWFSAVAVYYLLLCVLKFYLLRYGFGSNTKHHELLSFRNCSVMLLLLNITISVIIYLMLLQNKSTAYSTVILYGSAIYTFFRLLTAIVDSKKLKKLDSPTLSATKALNLSVALMALFSLQTVLFDRFGIDSKLKLSLNLFSGTVIGGAVIIIAVRMLIKAQKEIKIKK